VGIQKFPLSDSPYDQTAKVLAFRDAAHGLGVDWSLVPLAVTFANEGAAPVPGEPIAELPNLHGRTRDTCRLCGECDVGCNYGSKNTLDYTYLTQAWRAGAELRTLCEVHAFEPRDEGGYRVHYVVHDPASEGEPTDVATPPRRTLTCTHLILSAGTLGTTALMLRNRAGLPAALEPLGYGFSGNGDLLTFAMRAKQDGHPRALEQAIGPVITSAIRIPDALDDGPVPDWLGQGRGFYLEDAGAPAFASWMLELLEEPETIVKEIPKLWHYAMSLLHGPRHSEVGDMASALLGNCDLSAGALPLLGMGRDIPDGRLRLRGDLLELDWDKEGASAAYYDRVRKLSRRVAHELGGEFLDNPIWHENRVITVHSLGGCRMGRSEQEGVVDAYGNVFGCPGLHIADGSVMPGPVGANPSLTIAALADRFADAILEQPRDLAQVGGTAPASGVAGEGASVGKAPDGRVVSLSFTEEMKGYVTLGESDYDRGYRAGKKAGNGFMFHLTITADDVEKFIADPRHTGTAEGWIDSDQLGGRLPVSGGVFNLFVATDSRGEKQMLYHLQFSDAEQHPLTMTGFKEILHGHGLDGWSETTTLFTHVLAGHLAPGEDAGARTVASGILHIHPVDFARQLTTFRVHPAERVDALARFGALFAGELWSIYGPEGKA
jgi:cholesterol oxidase